MTARYLPPAATNRRAGRGSAPASSPGPGFLARQPRLRSGRCFWLVRTEARWPWSRRRLAGWPAYAGDRRA